MTLMDLDLAHCRGEDSSPSCEGQAPLPGQTCGARAEAERRTRLPAPLPKRESAFELHPDSATGATFVTGFQLQISVTRIPSQEFCRPIPGLVIPSEAVLQAERGISVSTTVERQPNWPAS